MVRLSLFERRVKLVASRFVAWVVLPMVLSVLARAELEVIRDDWDPVRQDRSLPRLNGLVFTSK